MATLATLNAQRSAAGASTIAAPLSTRQVREQAQYQSQTRAQNILSRAVADSYIDPRTGQDTRQFTTDAEGNRTLVEGTGTMGTIRSAQVYGSGGQVLRDLAMGGAENQYKEAPVIPQQQGAIAQNRFDRLVASGMTPAAAAEKTADTSGIKDAFNQVGTGRRPAPGIYTPNPSEDALKQRESEINAIVGKKLVPYTDKEGNIQYREVVDPELTAKLQNEARNRYLEQDKMEYDKYKTSKATEESLTPDVIAALEAARSQSTGRISGEVGISAVDAAPDNIKAIFEEFPEMAEIYEPLVEALARDDRMAATSLVATLQRLDRQGDRAAKVASDAIQASKEYHDKLAGMAKDSYDTQLDIAAEQKRQADFDRAHYEHQQSFVISQRVEQAAEDEMARRRMAAGQGFSSDTSGLGWMQREARKAQDAIDFLRSETNMVSAEMATRASNTYMLSVRELGQQYDKTLLGLENSLDSAIAEIQSTLNMGDEARAQAYESAYQKYLDKVSENDKEVARTYSKIVETLNNQAFELKKLNMQEDRADKRMQWQEEQANRRMEFQESQLDKRLQFSEGQANKRLEMELQKLDLQQERQFMENEKVQAKEIRDFFGDLEGRQTVQDYKNARNATQKAMDVLDAAIKSGNKLDMGVATEVLGVLYEKTLDPNSVVREGEYARAGLAQGIIGKVEAVLKALQGGDLTGINQDTIFAFGDAMNVMTRSLQSQAMAEYMPAITRMENFNRTSSYIKLDPREVLTEEFIDEAMLQSFDQSKKTRYNYDWGYFSTGISSGEAEDERVTSPLINALPETGMTMDEIFGDYSGLNLMSTPQSQRVVDSDPEESVGDILSSFGPVTQRYNTPISTKNYADSTVKAWGGKHLGLDIAMPAGSYVPSLTDGTLMSVEWNPKGWGLTATVRAADGAEVRYSHLMSIDPRLKIGQEIPKGAEFAQVGNTGNVFSTTGGDGTHLDFRVRKDGKYIDPFSYFS